MKSTKTLAILALLLVTAAPGVYAACTNATAAGTFGFTTVGTLILRTGPAPVGAVGSITFDLAGSAFGNQDRTVGGMFAHEKISGIYTISRGCAINLLAQVFDTSGHLVRTSTILGVLVNNGQQIRAIFKSVVLANGTNVPSVLTIEADRIHPHAE